MKQRPGNIRTVIISFAGVIAFIGLSIWGIIWLSRIPHAPIHHPSPLHGSGEVAMTSENQNLAGESSEMIAKNQNILKSAKTAALQFHETSGRWPASDEELQRGVGSYKAYQTLAQREARFETMKNGTLHIYLKSGLFDDGSIYVSQPVAP